MTTPLYVISHHPHDHSVALDNVNQLPVFALFPTFVPYVKLFAVGATFVKVYVAVLDPLFNNVSLTQPVLFCVHGCCAVIVVVVVVDQLDPSKLYAFVCNPAPASLALVICKLHATHSCPDALLNVNVGACLSILICADVLIASTLPAVSVLLYLTYCDAHVVPALHVTVTVVPLVFGVQVPVVSTQYCVVDDSFGVNVTEKSVFLHVLFALSVVTGGNVSIPFHVTVIFTVLFSLSLT